ncbi:MAG: response regulator [bacterium]|nr:response regulator [bacterium]
MARILVVDDQPHITYVFGLFLTRQGHEVTTATDGQDALDLLRAQCFDVLITDVDMPRMDGLTLVQNLHSVEGLRGVIVITGSSDFEAIAKSQGGCNVLVAPKPASPSRLADLVERLLEAEPSALNS